MSICKNGGHQPTRAHNSTLIQRPGTAGRIDHDDNPAPFDCLLLALQFRLTILPCSTPSVFGTPKHPHPPPKPYDEPQPPLLAPAAPRGVGLDVGLDPADGLLLFVCCLPGPTGLGIAVPTDEACRDNVALGHDARGGE